MSDEQPPSGKPPRPQRSQPDERPASSDAGSQTGPEGRQRAASAKNLSGSWIRLSGAGMELALITLAFGAVGAVADNQLNLQRPILSALAGMVGFTFGMVRFIRLAIAAGEATSTEHKQD